MTLDSPALLQFFKYAVAGGIATITHILIFHLVAWKVFPSLQEQDHAVRALKLKIHKVNDATRARNSMIGNVIAFMVANMVAYLANIYFVFNAGKYNVFVEILLFYAVSGLSAFLGTVLMGMLIRRLGLLTTYAFGANIFTAVMFNYVMRKYFIFYG